MRLDDGRFGDAVDLDRARFASRRRPGAVAAPGADARAALPRGAAGARQGGAVGRARSVNLMDRAAQLAGAGRAAHGAASPTRTSSRTGRFPLRRAAGVGGGGDPRVPPGAVRAAGRRAAGRRRGRGRARGAARQAAAAPRDAAAGRRSCGGTSRTGRSAYGYRPGRAAVWMAVLWAAGSVAFAQHTRRPPIRPGDDHRLERRRSTPSTCCSRSSTWARTALADCAGGWQWASRRRWSCSAGCWRRRWRRGPPGCCGASEETRVGPLGLPRDLRPAPSALPAEHGAVPRGSSCR